MKRILLLIWVLLYISLQSSSLFAEERKSPLEYYKPIYWIFGNNTDSKVEISFRYNLVKPKSWGAFYMAYTELLLWDIFDPSSPFRDINHSPEILQYESPSFSFVDYIRLVPHEHTSNGKDGDANRSLEKTYGEIQLSKGERYNFGIQLRYTYTWKTASQNADIDSYTGDVTTTLFFKLKGKGEWFDKEELYIKGGIGNHQWALGEPLSQIERYWMEIGLSFRILTKAFQPYFYIQYFKGYGESLLDYDKFNEDLRLGLTLKY